MHCQCVYDCFKFLCDRVICFVCIYNFNIIYQVNYNKIIIFYRLFLSRQKSIGLTTFFSPNKTHLIYRYLKENAWIKHCSTYGHCDQSIIIKSTLRLICLYRQSFDEIVSGVVPTEKTTRFTVRRRGRRVYPGLCVQLSQGPRKRNAFIIRKHH